MHDELKLEAQSLLDQEAGWGSGIGRFTMVNTEIAIRAIGKALARTLPPANTEADVERVAEALMDNDPRYRKGEWRSLGETAKEAFRSDARAAIAALSLTRPAGGEEAVDPAYDYAVSLLRALHGKHFPEQAALKMLPDTLGVLTQIDNLTSALTKPPTLPKEGEERGMGEVGTHHRERWTARCVLRDLQAAVQLSDEALTTDVARGTMMDAAQALHRMIALSSLPVRSGDVERAFRAGHAAGFDCADNTSRSEAGNADETWEQYASRAALATPQQVKEGDR